MDDVTGQVFLGGPEFVLEMRRRLDDEGVDLPRAIPRTQRQVGFFGLAEVIAAVAEELGIAEEELSEAWRRGDERAVAVTLARRLTGASGVEIGKRFGVTSARVSQLLRKVEERGRAPLGRGAGRPVRERPRAPRGRPPAPLRRPRHLRQASRRLPRDHPGGHERRAVVRRHCPPAEGQPRGVERTASREEGQYLWLFTSEGEIREALEGVGLVEPEAVHGPLRGLGLALQTFPLERRGVCSSKTIRPGSETPRSPFRSQGSPVWSRARGRLPGRAPAIDRSLEC